MWNVSGLPGDVREQSFANDDLRLGLLPAGTYALVVSGTAGETVGFNLLDEASATSLTVGTSTTATLNPSSSTILSMISGAAGQVVFLDHTAFSTTDTSGLGGSSTWSLCDSYGARVGSIWSLNSDSGRLTLPTTGTCTLDAEGVDVIRNGYLLVTLSAPRR